MFTLINQLIHAIRELTQEIHNMAVGQTQFDADLAALVTAVNNLITAINAFIALPPVVDLSTEDASVNAELTSVQAAIAGIPTPPAPPVPPGP